MKRRDFLKVAGAAAAGLPFPARAQQVMPVIGFLHSLSAQYIAGFMPIVRDGLKESGYVENQNVAIEYRAAEGRYDRLPALLDDLIARKVSVILAAGGSEPAKLAKAATSTIPIVFISGADPIKAGLVTSLNRPGGNVTGISLMGSELEAKRLEKLHELVPGETPLGVFIDPKFPDADLQIRAIQEATGAIKRPVEILRVSNIAEIEAAFATLGKKGAGGILVTQDPFFNTQREHFVTLAAHYKLPAIYNQREYTEVGGLSSYGTHFADAYRQCGVYVGKVLKGTRTSDLPVVQPIRFELVINAKTAKALGLEVPPKLLFTADEVIE
jgi:putative ABC transport system substrate-binding protein